MVFLNTTWLLVSTLLTTLIIYAWRNRRIYYYSLQFPGPNLIPIIGGSVKFIKALRTDLIKTLREMASSQPPVFKIWLANELYIINTEPEDLEVLMNSCLEKTSFYQMWNDFLKNSIFMIPVPVWKEKRRLINRTFNMKVLSSFHDTFVKYAKELVNTLGSSCQNEQTDILSSLWKCNLDIAIEALMDVDPVLVKYRYERLTSAVRAEKILMERFSKFWLFFDCIYKFSSLRKETIAIAKEAQEIGENIVTAVKERLNLGIGDDEIRRKRFANYMISLMNKGDGITESYMTQETVMMLIASSETTAIAINSVLLVLGLMPEIQDKLYHEVYLVSGNNKKDITLEDTNHLEYAGRVIKETMRLFPVIPLVYRSVDKDIRIGSYFYPAGTNFIILMAHVHRRPDLWPDPLKFNPDRFLPEEVEKRPRCAYMPFSFGPRNCVGFKYAMMSMKLMLAYIVKNFEVKAVNYSCLEDLEFEYHIVSKPKEYHFKLEKRTQ